jgi:hypothetical protein
MGFGEVSESRRVGEVRWDVCTVVVPICIAFRLAAPVVLATLGYDVGDVG